VLDVRRHRARHRRVPRREEGGVVEEAPEGALRDRPVRTTLVDPSGG
jgi:hypothetical protein